MPESATNSIYVTSPYLPPMGDYLKYVEKIWQSKQLTNNGPLVQELEVRLKEFLGVRHCLVVSSGTIALQLAIKALGLHGSLITTPFSFVATSSVILWEGCNPIYADVDRQSLCLDPNLIEDALTPDTSAILATHVYGYPCAVEKIQQIADRRGLKVIYDAAHAFGVKYKGQSLLNYGDISTLSFHATKLFHTVEGGAVITNDDELAERVFFMRNFGIKNESEFDGLGINAKCSEFHAAMGLCILPYVPEIISRRKKLSELYNSLFQRKNNMHIPIPPNIEYNYPYYPIFFSDEASLLEVLVALNNKNIFPRRYFYPTLNNLTYVEKQKTPIAEDLSSRVLCLPLYHKLTESECNCIFEVINSILTNAKQ